MVIHSNFDEFGNFCDTINQNYKNKEKALQDKIDKLTAHKNMLLDICMDRSRKIREMEQEIWVLKAKISYK